MALTPELLDDFVNLTLSNFKKHRWTDIALEFQDYICSRIVKSKGVVESGGKDISFRLKTKNTGNARPTGMYAVDVTAVDDVTISASVPWCAQTTNFSYDVYEDKFQSDRETIVRELQIREHDALSDMAELMEDLMWGAPSSTADNLSVMGIPFWLQKDTTTDGAFTGGNPSGFSGGAAGVDSTVYTRWRNWAFGYENVTVDDLVKKVKKSLQFTKFRAPVPHPELGFGETDYEIFSTYGVQEQLERLAETRNDNLGKDVARYMNQVTIGGTPLSWVPWLENNTSDDPLYGVNWKVLRPFVHRNINMRRNPVKQAARQHTVREVHYDMWHNFICYNRRATWVGSKSS